jgi:hypothetical protein
MIANKPQNVDKSTHSIDKVTLNEIENPLVFLLLKVGIEYFSGECGVKTVGFLSLFVQLDLHSLISSGVMRSSEVIHLKCKYINTLGLPFHQSLDRNLTNFRMRIPPSACQDIV